MASEILKSNYTCDTFDVSIIIVNWNSGKYLEETVNSFTEHSQNINYEIIIIDNNSNKEDVSYKYLDEVFKRINVTIIKSEENLGFAKANNVGMKRAKGRNFLILNPDIIFENNVLKILSDYLDNNDDVGMVGPRMLGVDGKFQQGCLKGKPYPADTLYHIIGLAKAFPNEEKYNGYALWHLDRTKIQECWAVSGACMMVKKSLYDVIGGIDEQFFMYQEETDWGIRTKNIGKKVIYNPEAKILHYGGVTTTKVKAKSVWYFTQSMMKFFKKYFWNDYNIFQKVFWTILIYSNFLLKYTKLKLNRNK